MSHPLRALVITAVVFALGVAWVLLMSAILL
jgi:hypothetical protein